MDAMLKSDVRLIEELSAEHAELLPELERIMNLAAGGAPQLAETIARLAGKLGAVLDYHIAQEDDVLFPAFAQASGGVGPVDQFVREHREIQALRDEMLAAQRNGANRQKLGQLALAFTDLLTSHIGREEMMLFPSMRDTFG